ncbi:NleF caspase inhibitor [Providencia rustigianii]|uniref:NleF caspase inhibitor n=1 Tax=Providencia rustigianii TaxID=158850 RepID=UPI002243563B|nr:NleF caspase inhibitor [Providencia rustigianii]
MFSANISHRHSDLIDFSDVSTQGNTKNNGLNSSTTVNELNAYHLLDSSQQNEVDSMINAYSISNKEQRNQLISKIDKIVDDLFEIRNSVYQFINEGTDSVRGEFKPGKNANDRDHYIRMLVAFNTINNGIEKVREDKGFAKCDVDVSLHLHHSSSVYGDLQSLNKLLSENSTRADSTAHLPNLTYNKGELQFG